jgi:hypothetical protein
MCYNITCKEPSFNGFEVIDMPRPHPHIDTDDLVKLYDEGTSIRKMSRHFGCRTEFVADALRSLGLKTDRRRIETDDDRILGMYRFGVPKSGIAEILGISEMTVGKRLVEMGVPRENRSDAIRTRNARMTASERADHARAAHDAVRGMKRTHEDLCRRAAGKAKAAKPGSMMEEVLGSKLVTLGLPVVYQRNVDKYNIDLSIWDSVAVEVSGRPKKGPDLARIPERVKLLFDLDWSLVLVWSNTRSYAIADACAEYVASLAQEIRRNPSLRRKYWVVRGDGKVMAECRPYSDDLPGILAPIRTSR